MQKYIQRVIQRNLKWIREYTGRDKFRILRKRPAQVVFALMIAALGAYLLQTAHAATFSVSSEAESGTLSGSASIISDPSASGSSAVTFGSSLTPTNLQVFTGGNNIALVWDMPTSPIQSVEVFRNNQQVATVSPSSDVSIQNQQLGREYDDNAVTAGSTYQYKVRAVLSNGSTSAFTPIINATQPTSTQPVPNIVVDAGDASTAVVNYMNTYIVPVLKTWYPKDANYLAYPTYTAPTTLTIQFNTAATSEIGAYCYTTASGSASTIVCNPNLVGADMVKSDNGVAAAFVHESTHSIQDSASAPSWVIEGGASFASDFYARQNINTFVPREGDQLGGYTPGAWFINYMRNTYDQSFPRDINVAAHQQNYSDSIISKDTGSKFTSATQAWQSAVDAYNSSTGAITGIGGNCIEVQNGTVTNGTRLVLDTCNTQSQRLVTNAIFNLGVGSNMCLDDNAGSGTKADNWTCTSGATNESWAVLGNGEVMGESSHTCLTNQGGVSSSGNPVVLSACTGDASQLWTVGGNYIKNTATSLCLTDPNSSTSLGTETTVANCNSSGSQTWKPSGQTTVNGDLPQQWALTYHSAGKSGLFEITSPTLGNVSGTDYCMDDSASGTANGTIVQYWGCDNTNAQYWTMGANGTIVNVNSNTCLSTAGGSSAIGTQLVIRTCDGGADQQWTTSS
jgi:hypothetical protein